VSIRKMVQQMRANQLAWNPVEPFSFTVASEDCNLYTYDMRKLDAAANVHRDHVSAVLDVSYSPTGKEFCSASYDRSVRIFAVRGDSGRSREVYTAPRMQRVWACRFTPDSHFILSGSEDTIVRVWKAQASTPLGTLAPRQERRLKYSAKLLDRFGHVGEVRKINKTRRLPRAIFKERAMRKDMAEAARKKQERVASHSKNPALPVPLRQRHIVKVIE
jgi:WD repeat and SOF domain-containing protein 1